MHSFTVMMYGIRLLPEDPNFGKCVFDFLICTLALDNCCSHIEHIECTIDSSEQLWVSRSQLQFSSWFLLCIMSKGCDSVITRFARCSVAIALRKLYTATWSWRGRGWGGVAGESETLLNLNPLLKRLTALRHNVSCHLCSVMDIKGLPLFPHNKPPFSQQISITK